jgi:phage gp36-like protein
MAFLTKPDLYLSILQDELDEITRDDDALVESALSAAIEEMRTYLFDSYDVEEIFSQTSSNRHQMLVRVGSDIAIWFLVARLQAGQDTEDRRRRYDRAIAWLKAVQKSQTFADLPRKESTEEDKIAHGSNTKRSNHY